MSPRRRDRRTLRTVFREDMLTELARIEEKYRDIASFEACCRGCEEDDFADVYGDEAREDLQTWYRYIFLLGG